MHFTMTFYIGPPPQKKKRVKNIKGGRGEMRTRNSINTCRKQKKKSLQCTQLSACSQKFIHITLLCSMIYIQQQQQTLMYHQSRDVTSDNLMIDKHIIAGQTNTCSHRSVIFRCLTRLSCLIKWTPVFDPTQHNSSGYLLKVDLVNGSLASLPYHSM